MNERQPYEHLIANKLQQLPVPDVEQSWQEMKRLLDEERSPRGAGGKRSGPGGGRWWAAGIIAVVLVSGVWLFVENRGSSKEDLASLKHTPAQNTGAIAGNKDTPGKESASGKTVFNNQTTNTTAKTSTLNNNTDNVSSNVDAPGAAVTNTGDSKTAGAATVKTGSGNTVSPASSATPNNTTASGSGVHNTKGKNRLVMSENAGEAPYTANSLPVAKDKPASGTYSKEHPKNKNADKNAKDKTASNRYRRTTPASNTNSTAANAATVKKAPGNKKPGNNAAVNATNKPLVAHNNRRRHRPGSNGGNSIASTGRNNTDKNNKTTKPGALAANQGHHNTGVMPGNAGNHAPAADPLPAKQEERRERLAELIASLQPGTINTALAAGDSIDNSIDTSHLLNDSTKARMAKAKLPPPVVAKKEKTPFHLNLNLSLPPLNPLSMRNDGDPWWGAGLSFNAPMPIGSQTRYKFNINGSTSLLADYLPSPYLEFHLNQYVFLQTEINLSAPQYTKPLLMFKNTSDVAGSSPAMSLERTIYVQKMYYFNWPFSIHYSPYDNFYLSTGLQFSSFQSGLAMINDTQYPVAVGSAATTSSSRLVKFKDDSIAVKLAPNEWRWQLGAEYYWNRFTVGFRYNQSLKQLVNLSVASGLPNTQSRNSTAQFFLRFNIFEGRSRDNNSSNPPPSLVRW